MNKTNLSTLLVGHSLSVQPPSQEVTAENLVISASYQWMGETLHYIGVYNQPIMSGDKLVGTAAWYQFEKVFGSGDVWCEVDESQLKQFTYLPKLPLAALSGSGLVKVESNSARKKRLAEEHNARFDPDTRQRGMALDFEKHCYYRFPLTRFHFCKDNVIEEIARGKRGREAFRQYPFRPSYIACPEDLVTFFENCARTNSRRRVPHPEVIYVRSLLSDAWRWLISELIAPELRECIIKALVRSHVITRRLNSDYLGDETVSFYDPHEGRRYYLLNH